MHRYAELESTEKERWKDTEGDRQTHMERDGKTTAGKTEKKYQRQKRKSAFARV